MPIFRSDGIAIASPMDAHADVVPFDKVSKIKSIKGDILKVSVYKQLTKTILIEAMDKDTPAVVFDMAFKEYSVTGFSMKQGGRLMVDLDDATSVPVGNLFVLDRTMTFGK